jgi:hypothetical protein
MEEDTPKVLPKAEDLKARLQEIMQISAGAGMQALTREGNFRCPEDHKRPSQKDTLLYYYIYHTSDDPEPKSLEPDTHFHKWKINGEGPDARLEYQQWGWVASWDENFQEKVEKEDPEALSEALKDPPDKAPDLPKTASGSRDLLVHLKAIADAIVEAEARGVQEPKQTP